jgi:HEAT repeat protein
MSPVRSVAVFPGLLVMALVWGTSTARVPAQAPAEQTAVEELTQQLFSENSMARANAARQLRRFGPAARSAVPALIELVAHPEVEVRVAAIRTLGAIGPGARDAVPVLVTRLDDREPVDAGEVWLVAGEALGQIGGEAALEGILPLLVPDPNDLRYRGACLVLHTMGAQAAPAVPRLLEILASGTEPLGPPLYALEGIGAHGAEALPALIGLLDHENFHYQYFVCRVLSAMGEKAAPAVPKLMDRLQHGAPSVRRHAALALGDIGPVGGQPAVEALTAALSDPLAPVRQDAATALGQLGPTARSAAPALAAAAADKAFPARTQAAASLWKIDPSQKGPGATSSV